MTEEHKLKTDIFLWEVLPAFHLDHCLTCHQVESLRSEVPKPFWSSRGWVQREGAIQLHRNIPSSPMSEDCWCLCHLENRAKCGNMTCLGVLSDRWTQMTSWLTWITTTPCRLASDKSVGLQSVWYCLGGPFVTEHKASSSLFFSGWNHSH